MSSPYGDATFRAKKPTSRCNAKARSAALFRRATKAFQDDLAAGGHGLRYLSLPGVVAAEGGVPLVIDGKIVGAIGTSGGTYAQDGQVAVAGAAALK